MIRDFPTIIRNLNDDIIRTNMMIVNVLNSLVETNKLLNQLGVRKDVRVLFPTIKEIV
jgi:hypothetical protein